MLPFVVDPLEAGDDGDLAAVERLEDLRALDGPDARLGERVVGQHFDLVPEKRPRLAAFGVDGHGRERRAHLLAGRRERVHLARVGDLRDVVREPEQPIGLAAHRADDEDDAMARALGGDRAPRDVANPLDRADRSATELLTTSAHGRCRAKPPSDAAFSGHAASARRSMR